MKLASEGEIYVELWDLYKGVIGKSVRNNNRACDRGWDLCAKVGFCTGLLVKVLRDKNYGLRFFGWLKEKIVKSKL
jgi:hypothetical protein